MNSEGLRNAELPAPSVLPGCSCPRGSFGTCPTCMEFSDMLRDLGCYTNKDRTPMGKKAKGRVKHHSR